MKRLNKGEWVQYINPFCAPFNIPRSYLPGREGIVVGFQTTFFSEAGAREPREHVLDRRPDRKPTIECAWVLLIGDSSPCLFDLRFLERIEVENET